jgi:hypothetical protein
MTPFHRHVFGVAAVLCAAAGAAAAGPVTFAQVSEGSTGDGVTWTNDGSGIGTLNTTRPGGDRVTFDFSNVPGLSSALSHPLAAIETINGGLGVSTTALATTAAGYDFQAINAPMTISYTLAKPIDGQTNLLTITITPNTPGANGLIFSGQNGGTGAASSTSQPTMPAASYTERFSSAFLDFPANASISAAFSFSSLDPTMLIGLDGLLDSFTAEDTGTFSSEPSPFLVREPASLSVLAAGLLGLCALRRRRLMGT